MKSSLARLRPRRFARLQARWASATAASRSRMVPPAGIDREPGPHLTVTTDPASVRSRNSQPFLRASCPARWVHQRAHRIRARSCETPPSSGWR